MRGIRDKTKREAIFDHHRTTCDMLILQETHSTSEDEVFWTNEWGNKIFFSHGTNKAKGVMILLNSNLFEKIQNIKADPNGRYVIVDVTCQGKKISIVAI